MDWFIIFIVYLVLSISLCVEGNKRRIGGLRAFVASVLLTPLVGAILVMYSKRKISIHHFVKLHPDKIGNNSLRKGLHANGKDEWIELRNSEMNVL